MQIGNPIDLGSGNKYEQAVDYETTGPNRLRFVRHYNSQSSLTTLATTLGLYWRSDYDRYIRINSPTSVFAERADGQQLLFTLVNGIWTPDSDVDVSVTNSGSTWTLTDRDDTVETYATNTVGTVGILNTIQVRNGYTQALTYTNGQLTSVIDSYNRSLSLTYNSGGLLSSVTTPDSTTISYAYAAAGYGSNITSVTYSGSPSATLTYLFENAALPNALTGILDENGNRYATWSYDVSGRALTSAHGGSLNADLTTVTYNDTNGSRIFTNALGVTDTYMFATLQGVPKVTQISRAATASTAAATELFIYDANGYTASQTDWNGDRTTYTNNVRGLPTVINEAVGTSAARTTTFVYDAAFVHLPESIATPGLTTSFTYDRSGNPLTKTLTDTTATIVPYSTKGQARTWTYTWSNFLPTSVKTPNGNTTAFAYESSGALVQVTNALSQVTNITAHTGGGLPQTIVDPNSVTTTLSYDARQHLTSSVTNTSAGLLTTSYTYDAAENLTGIRLPDGSGQNNTYDTAHRLIGILDAVQNQMNYTLDGLGDPTQTSVLNPSHTVQRQHSGNFDALGRVLQDIGGVSQTTTFSYDPNGNALTVADPLSHTAQQAFDALNRLTRIIDAASGITKMTYDPHDRPVTVVDPNSGSTTYVYDGFGDVIQRISRIRPRLFTITIPMET